MRIGMRLCRILGPNKYPPRPLCVALNQSTNLAYLQHTRPVSTLVGHPSILDLPVQYMLSYLYHCDMSLGVIAGKLEVTRPDLHQFLWERLSPLSWKFARNHRGFSSFVREGWGEVFYRVICGVKGTRQGLIPQSVKVGWIGDGGEYSKSTHVSAALFLYVFEIKISSWPEIMPTFFKNVVAGQNLVKLKKEQRFALICCEQTGCSCKCWQSDSQ